MARSSECKEQYAQKTLDTSDIVREAIFRQLSPATRMPDVFETLDPATDTLCRIAMRLIFKFVVFLRIGVFYCLCC
ncbi:MAG: hypothetical protein QOJ42_4116 [Acidobacteriaceae bacterium]|nr:hypothetical protein [Acidobacteriaceae bacterium]